MKYLVICLFFISNVCIAQSFVEWQQSLGGTGPESAKCIQQTNDGGYIVAGSSESNDGDVSGNHGDRDFWIVKLSNNGNIEWENSFGGSGDDLANSIQQTSDGGYIVAGYSASNDGDVTENHGAKDYWVVKLSNNGGLEWEHSLGGSSDDSASSIQQTSDGGFMVAGSSESNDGDVTGNHGARDYWVVKLSNNGNIEWEKSFGGAGIDSANYMQQAGDGGYIVAGYSRSNDGDVTGNQGDRDCWVVKLSNNGSIEWQNTYGGTYADTALSIQQTSDGGFIMSGFSASNDGDVTENKGSWDYWVVKLSNNGNIEWEKSFGGTEFDFASSIQLVSDGGYMVAGTSWSIDGDVTGNHGQADFWVVKLSNNGNIEWENSFGGTNDDFSNSIQQTSDGGYIVIGYSSSNDGDVTENKGGSDYWILKLSSEPVGINNVLTNTRLNIYPSPANLQINILTDLKMRGSEYTIYNLVGNPILKGIISDENTTLNIVNLLDGLYIIQIHSKKRKPLN